MGRAVLFDQAKKKVPDLPEGLQEVVRDLSKILREAHDRRTRATNYKRMKQFPDAFDAYREALEILPASSDIFSHLGLAYEAFGDLPKSIEHVRHAMRLEPGSGYLHNLFGKLLSRAGSDREAIFHLRRAVEIEPLKADYHYSYGRLCPEDECTIRHFLRYLELEPQGPFRPVVIQYLARHGVDVPSEPENLRRLFLDREFAALEERLSGLLDGRRKDQDGDSLLSQAYQSILKLHAAGNTHESQLELHRLWTEQAPTSHFAHALLGLFLVDYVWWARGTGFANTVVDEEYRLFQERLMQARTALETAFELDPRDLIVPAALITVAMGLGSDEDEVERQFRRAVAADAATIDAYSKKLTYLMPKWQGSEEEEFAFSRWCVEHARPGSNIASILGRAHWEKYYILRRINPASRYFDDPKIWKEVKSHYHELMTFFPESKRLRNWYARAAYLAGDLDTAREHLDRLGTNWLPEVWGRMDAYQKTRIEIGLAPLEVPP